MKATFTKSYSSPKEIVQLLKSRGMLIKDEQKAESYLMNIGCQELMDKYWITNPEYFANAGKFGQTLAVIDKELAASKEDYIEDFRRNYVEPYPPAWMITEVLSFGNLNYIYSNIASNKLMKQVSAYFGLQPQVFTSWLTVLANLRNMCCHHARVWNRDFMLSPAEPRRIMRAWIDTSKMDKKKIFYRLCIIRYLLSFVSPNNNLTIKLRDLLLRFPSLDMAAMGFSRNWLDEYLWQSE